MNTRQGSLWVALVLGIAALALPQANAEDLMHARVSFDAGGAMVKGTDDADWSYATVNTLILPGDTLWVDKGGTMELEMAGGSFLRMADGSKAEVVSLPPSATIRGWSGAFCVQRISRSTGDFVFETPACSVEVEPDSQIRFDIVGEGATTVTVHWGRATIRAQAGGSAVSCAIGDRAYVDPGCLSSMPVPFDRSVEDSFDIWSRERAQALALGPETLPAPVAAKAEVIGVADLAPYGEWVYVDRVHYWRPTVVVDYVPYRYGHWSYVPECGYVWAGSYPFCYVTSHYGRWTHHRTYGWLWHHDDVWGPAWVATVRYGPNFVWCPLDPWDRPVVASGSYYTVGGSRFGLYASSYCVAADLLFGPCPVHACSRTVVSRVPASDIHIWNIHVNAGSPGSRARRHRMATFNTRSPLEVRDYSPRRVIRGPAASGPHGRSAATRIATLEKEEGRAQFASVRATGRRGVRTPKRQSERAARIRNVTVAPSANAQIAGGGATTGRSWTSLRASGRERASRVVSTAPSTARVNAPKRPTRPSAPPRTPVPSPQVSTPSSRTRVVRTAPSTPRVSAPKRPTRPSAPPRTPVPSPQVSTPSSRTRVVRTAPSTSRVNAPKPPSRPSAPPRTPVPSPQVSTPGSRTRVVTTAPSSSRTSTRGQSGMSALPTRTRVPSRPAMPKRDARVSGTSPRRVASPPRIPSRPAPRRSMASPSAATRTRAITAPSRPVSVRPSHAGTSRASRPPSRGRR